MSTTDQSAGVAFEPRANPLSAASDADLLDAWTQDGCREALSTIIERYSVLVLSVCRRSCRNAADADDAFQATFLFLVRSADKIRHPEQLPGWLHRVAQRAATATLAVGGPTYESVVDFPEEPTDPLDRLTQRHAAIVLDEELANLPEHYRTAIVRHVLQDESYLTLAEQSGTSVGTVRGRVQRGKQLLARRLRQRGVVPVIAVSAATHWTVPSVEAGQAAASLVADAAFPEHSVSPIEPSLLQHLLTQGSSAMTKSFVASAGVLGFAVVAFLLHDLIRPTQTTRAEGTLLAQFSPAPSPPGVDFAQAADPFGAPPSRPAPTAPPGASDSPADDPFAAPPSGLAVPRSTPPSPARVSPARSGMASSEPADVEARQAAAHNALGREVELPPSVPLEGLAAVIQQLVDVPTRVETRALEFAEVPASSEIKFGQGQRDLRSALREALRPLGLRAVVDQEGTIVITADPSVLVHRGVGVSRWINVDDDAERAIAEKLAMKVSFSFVEETLENSLRIIAEQQQLPIQLDRRALEDTPYTPDTPVNLSLQDVTLRSFLELLLRDLKLTYTVQGELLVVTTPEVAEFYPLTRIYWLEGTGLTGGSGRSVIAAVESTLEPDAWESAGGTSRMRTITGGAESRPAIIVTAPYTLHHQIENLLSAMRQSHFGPDTPFEVSEPMAAPVGMGGSGFMGGMGMGSGFMGGGGMGGGGMGGGGMGGGSSQKGGADGTR